MESSQRVGEQYSALNADGRITEVLDASPYIAMVTNSCRQVVFGNRELSVFLGRDIPDYIGLRTGDILECDNAKAHPGGCGTSAQCRFCGLVNTMMSALSTGTMAVGETQVETHRICQRE